MQQEPKPGSLIDQIQKKLGIKIKKPKGDPKKVPLGSGLANNAKLAIKGRRRQIDEASGY